MLLGAPSTGPPPRLAAPLHRRSDLPDHISTLPTRPLVAPSPGHGTEYHRPRHRNKELEAARWSKLVVCSPQWLIGPSYIEIMATPLRLQTPNRLTSSVSSSNNPHAAPSQDASCSSRKTGEKREDGWRRKCCKEGDKICGGPTCGKKRRGQGCVSTRPLGQQGESCGSGLVDASVCFLDSTGLKCPIAVLRAFWNILKS